MFKKFIDRFKGSSEPSYVHPTKRHAAFVLPPHIQRKNNIPYRELLEAAKADPQNVDFMELRLAHVESPEYAPYEPYIEEQLQLKAAMNKQDHAASIKVAERLLEKFYLDIRGHMMLGFLYDQIGNSVKSSFHGQFGGELLRSIFKSGDGHGFDTAYIVINTTEEYALIQSVGLRSMGQKLMVHNGKEFDVLIVQAPNIEQPLEFYFNIDLPKGWLNLQHAKG